MTDQTTTYMQDYMSQKLAVRFVVDCGQDWTDSRMHCCDVYYRDNRYIQQTIRKWACTQREAYEMAAAAWTVEKSEGRAL